MLTFTTHREGDQRGREKQPRRPLLTEEGFHDAIDAHGPAVHRFATAHVGPDHAEDVMAETFATAWKRRASFVDAGDGGIEAWFITIARNMVYQHRRAERRWIRGRAEELRSLARDSADDELATAERVDASELVRQARVLERLDKLPAREREPFLMFAVDGFSYQEIAAILGIPLGTVQSRISRGRSRLSRALRGSRGGDA